MERSMGTATQRGMDQASRMGDMEISMGTATQRGMDQASRLGDMERSMGTTTQRGMDQASSDPVCREVHQAASVITTQLNSAQPSQSSLESAGTEEADYRLFSHTLHPLQCHEKLSSPECDGELVSFLDSKAQHSLITNSQSLPSDAAQQKRLCEGCWEDSGSKLMKTERQQGGSEQGRLDGAVAQAPVIKYYMNSLSQHLSTVKQNHSHSPSTDTAPGPEGTSVFCPDRDTYTIHTKIESGHISQHSETSSSTGDSEKQGCAGEEVPGGGSTPLPPPPTRSASQPAHGHWHHIFIAALLENIYLWLIIGHLTCCYSLAFLIQN